MDFSALLIVPPFAALHQPALGPHLLQACAKEAGFKVQVFYANMSFAKAIGMNNYLALANQPVELIGERIFAASAYRVPVLGRRDINDDLRLLRATMGSEAALSLGDLQRLERQATKWLDTIIPRLLHNNTRVFGCSTSFEQTAASIALLRRLKDKEPSLITIIGGANCEGEMAEGILSLDMPVDFIFSGESEKTFPDFLRSITSNNLPQHSIIRGEPCADLNSLPTPNYSEYFEQLSEFFPEEKHLTVQEVWLSYESSRGCWWGQKHHCTFCGLNGETMAIRSKSSDRVFEDLTLFRKKYKAHNICMTDNIMPYDYFRSLIPRLAQELKGLKIFYEQKSNLSFAQMLALRDAGVTMIQPGIESLSSSLLRRMKKGVSARQNIALLRYARSLGISAEWSILYGFPGDEIVEYTEQLSIVPYLVHLSPPTGVKRLIIERFSPYFDEPEKHGVTNIRPWDSYISILPENANAQKIAYHFVADYHSEALENPYIIRQLSTHVRTWQNLWKPGCILPRLEVTRLDNERFLLVDTRPTTEGEYALTFSQARLVLLGIMQSSTTSLKTPIPEGEAETKSNVEMALHHKWVVELDGQIVPLATSNPEIFNSVGFQERGIRVLSQAIQVLSL